MPVVADFLLNGRETPFRYFAPDSFYYHTVARNIAMRGAISFDGTYPTNGFHPLWQAFLALLYKVSHIIGWGEIGYHAFVLITCTTLATAAIGLIGATLLKGGRILPSSFVFAPVGIYAMLLFPFWLWAIDVKSLVLWSQGPFPLFGTLWSYINGMESSLLLFSYAILAWIFVQAKGAPAVVAAKVGFSCSVLVLSRLDHVFVAMMFPAWYVVRAFRQRSLKAAMEMGFCTLCMALPITAYLLFNWSYSGNILPISGSLKTTFPHPTALNLLNLQFVAAQPYADELSLSRMYRCAQVLIPAAAAILFLARAMFRWWNRKSGGSDQDFSDSFQTFLLLTAGGVLLLSIYDFLFVPPFAMGHWYTPLSVLFVSLSFFARRNRSLKSGLLGIVFCGVSVLFIFWFAHFRPDYHWLYAHYYFKEAPEIRSFYKGRQPRLVEYDDGIVAYSTGFPCLSGTGLMLDPQAAVQRKRGRLEALAQQRGFDLVTSLVYFLPEGMAGAHHDLGKEGAERAIARFSKQHARFRYVPDYVSASGNVWILRRIEQ